MTPIELLLSKIVLSVLKKSVIVPVIGKALEIVSLFEVSSHFINCIESTNDCEVLQVCGLKIVSNEMPGILINQFIDIGEERFTFERTNSGLYIASNLAPSFAATPSDFPKFDITPNDFPKFE